MKETVKGNRISTYARKRRTERMQTRSRGIIRRTERE